MTKLGLFLSTAAATLMLASCDTSSGKTEVTPNGSAVNNAEAILAKMTLEEKIGQVLQGDISTVTPEDARKYNLGSVLNGGNSAPGGGKVAEPEAWIALADAYWKASTDKSDGGVGIPLIWGTDAVHGHNNLQTATMFPHNSALGATNNPELMREIGDITAKEIRATGLDWTFAPTLAVALDDRWGRAYESYSENPEIVANYASAMVEGLQGKPGDADFLKGDNVVATAKHFVGDGGTQFGIDKGDTIGDVKEILNVHAAGYAPSFEAGVQTVMASFSSINGEKMHGSKHMLTTVLRDEMGFDGFVVGDWNGHGEVPGCTVTNCLAALHAGIDMYMASDSWRGMYDSLLAQAKSGELDLARLDEAVLRILKVKMNTDLFGAGLPSKRSTADTAVLLRPAHKEVARRAVRESLVLLKNQSGTLPLNPNSTVLIAGSGADSMQQQTGGWSLNWQGDNNPNSEFKSGETIFSGFEKALGAEGGKAVLSVTGEYEGTPDAAIVVFGEQPYAEYRGDRSDLVFEFTDGENLALIKSLKAKNIPVISVFLTGRPMWMNPHLNASDAFVVAWLPGTEGGGVADVLVGNTDGTANHDFKGKLSFSWPSDGTGTPIDASSKTGVLYPYGYGLNYGSTEAFEPLSEESGVSNAGANFEGRIVTRGDAAKPFGMYLGDSSNLKTPITGLTGSSLGGLISIRGTDYKAQEDSRELTWAGGGKGIASFRTSRAIDLTELGSTDNLALALEWRIDAQPTGALEIALGCGDGCAGSLDITKMTTALTKDQWTTSYIPVSCFTQAGLDAKNLSTALSLSTDKQAKITLYSADIKTADTINMACPI